MKYKVNIGGGGVFSKYMIAIQNLILVPVTLSKIYLNIADTRTKNNMFDYVFKQSFDDDYKNIDFINCLNYSNSNPIENSPHKVRYQEIIDLLEFNPKILDLVKYYKNRLGIDENTIGVHIRLTDMNIYHLNEYGYVSISNYTKLMDKNKKYFIASDNNQSLIQLKDSFDNVVFVNDLIRGEKDNEDTLSMFLNNFDNPKIWEEAFLEMLLLSECGELICRTSNVANAAIIHSKTIKNIIRV